MDIGCHLPTQGRVATRDALMTFCREAEARQMASLWVSDHVVFPTTGNDNYPSGRFPHAPHTPYLEPVAVLAAAAMCTERARLGSSVFILGHRNPVVMAKMLTTIDTLSNGRLICGVGVGWWREEFAALGYPFKERGARANEGLEVLKCIWTQEEASYHGEYVNFDRVWSYPKPVQRPHPPVILGTFASKWGRKRVAEMGDGWIPIPLVHEDLLSDIRELHDLLKEQGRDLDSVPISMFDITETTEDDLKRYADSGLFVRAIPRCPTEDKDTVLHWLDRYAEIGRTLA